MAGGEPKHSRRAVTPSEGDHGATSLTELEEAGMHEKIEPDQTMQVDVADLDSPARRTGPRRVAAGAGRVMPRRWSPPPMTPSTGTRLLRETPLPSGVQHSIQQAPPRQATPAGVFALPVPRGDDDELPRQAGGSATVPGLAPSMSRLTIPGLASPPAPHAPPPQEREPEPARESEAELVWGESSLPAPAPAVEAKPKPPRTPPPPLPVRTPLPPRKISVAPGKTHPGLAPPGASEAAVKAHVAKAQQEDRSTFPGLQPKGLAPPPAPLLPPIPIGQLARGPSTSSNISASTIDRMWDASAVKDAIAASSASAEISSPEIRISEGPVQVQPKPAAVPARGDAAIAWAEVVEGLNGILARSSPSGPKLMAAQHGPLPPPSVPVRKNDMGMPDLSEAMRVDAVRAQMVRAAPPETTPLEFEERATPSSSMMESPRRRRFPKWLVPALAFVTVATLGVSLVSLIAKHATPVAQGKEVGKEVVAREAKEARRENVPAHAASSAMAMAPATTRPAAPKPPVTASVAASPPPAETAAPEPAAKASSVTSSPAPKAAAADEGKSAYERAVRAHQSGDATKARSLYRIAVEKEPHNFEAQVGLGDIERQQGDKTAAALSYRRALAENPAFYPALLGLADVLWETGEKSQAQERYTEITKRFSPSMYPIRVRQRLNGVDGP
jgi:TolA-binding protein